MNHPVAPVQIMHKGCAHEVVSFSGSICHWNKTLMAQGPMACPVSLAIWRAGGMFCSGIDGLNFLG